VSCVRDLITWLHSLKVTGACDYILLGDNENSGSPHKGSGSTEAALATKLPRYLKQVRGCGMGRGDVDVKVKGCVGKKGGRGIESVTRGHVSCQEKLEFRIGFSVRLYVPTKDILGLYDDFIKETVDCSDLFSPYLPCRHVTWSPSEYNCYLVFGCVGSSAFGRNHRRSTRCYPRSKESSAGEGGVTEGLGIETQSSRTRPL